MACLARWGMGRVVIALLMLLALGQGGTLALGNVTLSGIVYGGSAPLANVTVKLINAATSAQIGSDVTDAAGQYSFSVASGTYNLQFFSPSGSGFDDAITFGITVASANVTQNIILMSKTRSLTGKIRASDGTPLKNVWIKAYPMSGGNGQPLGTAMTDATGAYALALPIGTYYCNLNGDDTCGVAGAPAQWGVNSILTNLMVSFDNTRDIAVPFVTLTGTVLDQNSVGLANVTMSFNGTGTFSTGGNGWARHTLVSSSATPVGSYSLALLPGTYDVILTPVRGSGHGREYNPGLALPYNRVFNFYMTPANRLSGYIRAGDGTPLKNVWIKAYPMSGGDGQPSDSIATDTTGAYTLYLAGGYYYCSVNGGATCGLADAPSAWGIGSALNNLQVFWDTSNANVIVPFLHLTGKVIDTRGNGVSGVSVAFDGGGTITGGGSAWVKHTFTSAPSPAGSYNLGVLPGIYSVSLTPPDGSTFAKTDYSGIAFSTDMARNWVVNGSLQLSGTIHALDGTPLRGVWIKAYPMSGGTGLPVDSAATDNAGHYVLNLPAGTYYCNLNGTSTCGVADAASLWGVSSILSNIYLNSDAVCDLTVPFVRLSGVVTDSAGVGVGGVTISLDGSGPLATGGSGWAKHTAVSASTAPLGVYSVALPPGSYSEKLIPLDGSGFAQTNLSGVSIAANLLQNILLTRLGSLDPRPSTLSFLLGSGYEVDLSQGGAPKTRTIRLYNIGSQAVTFTGGAAGTPGLALTGRCAGDFVIQNVTPATGTPLAPGAYVTITIKFAPTVTANTLGLDAALVISSDNPIVPTLTIPLLGDAVPVELSGFKVE